MSIPSPSLDLWLKEAKADATAPQVGMYLTHNGVVRETSRAKARNGMNGTRPVVGMRFSFDAEKRDRAIERAYKMPGIFYIRVWLNEGVLSLGDDIMYVLIGGDIRPHVVDALQALVGELKDQCVSEEEVYAE